MKVKLWQIGIIALFSAILTAYIVAIASITQGGGINGSNDTINILSTQKWEVGDWWVVKTAYNNSIFSGIPEDEPTSVLLRYEVISKNTDEGKKKDKDKSGKESKSIQISYVIRETYLSNPEIYRDLYYKEGKMSKSLYIVETHYYKRGRNVTNREYYDGDTELDVPVITPALANENSGQKKYEKQTVSYDAKKKGKMHISGINFNQVDKFDLRDGESVKTTQLIHSLAPWPIYEKTDYIESELLDYSGWHELSEEAMAKIPKEHKDKAKTDAKKFHVGSSNE